MHLNANFDQPVLMQADEIPWQASPMAGVQRKMLDRIGNEKARATSLVRYAPGSHFKPHVHTGGEEFLVLDGVFQDEHGDYPTGSYLRNPPQSQHMPGSKPGCIIFVKLWQFDPDDRQGVRIQTAEQSWQTNADNPTFDIKPLYEDNHETVQLERWAGGELIERNITEGLELLVLNGGFQFNGEPMQQWSWLRLPTGFQFSAMVSAEGCEVWSKTAAHRITTPT